MKWKFEEEFRKDKPETIGETDSHYDLDNYKDWLEDQLSEARSKLHQPTVISSVCEHEFVRAPTHDKYNCVVCIKCMIPKRTDL